MDTCTVQSLDGGGAKGVYTLVVLAELESHRPATIRSTRFDLRTKHGFHYRRPTGPAELTEASGNRNDE